MARGVPVSLEVAPKRTMASAIDWPGWSRGAKTEDEALANLARYGERYGRVVRGVADDPPGATEPADLHVVERQDGGSGTEFGVPGLPLRGDDDRITPAELERLIAILRASWKAFDRAADRAEGVELTKGPRGGGRDLDKIRGHVLEAEAAYVHQLGARPPKGGSLADVQKVGIAALTARARGETPAEPTQVKRPWLPRYYVRRSARHILDHAWEIEDRAGSS